MTLNATTRRALDGAMLETVEAAYKGAVINAKTEFNRTPGRTRSGQLMNSIYRHYDNKTRVGYVGAKLPYAAQKEFGGTIHPVNAKHLWVKNWVGAASAYKRLTPKEFMAQKAADPRHFALFRNPKTSKLIAAYRAGRGGTAQTVALFALVDEVTQPATPFIRPAVEKAYAAFNETLIKRIKADL